MLDSDWEAPIDIEKEIPDKKNPPISLIRVTVLPFWLSTVGKHMVVNLHLLYSQCEKVQIGACAIVRAATGDSALQMSCAIYTDRVRHKERPRDETWTDFDGPSWIQYDLFRKNKLPGSKKVNLVKFMLWAKKRHDDTIQACGPSFFSCISKHFWFTP